MAVNAPFCERCHKTVEAVSHYIDHQTDSVVFVAYCHGEKERIVIASDLLDSLLLAADFDMSKIRLDGSAFKKRLSISENSNV